MDFKLIRGSKIVDYLKWKLENTLQFMCINGNAQIKVRLLRDLNMDHNLDFWNKKQKLLQYEYYYYQYYFYTKICDGFSLLELYSSFQLLQELLVNRKKLVAQNYKDLEEENHSQKMIVVAIENRIQKHYKIK
eukprot:TRINITY_DN18561_c0_g1_i1.p1 TRINITY_DN18561_c0_g1~~TRINITY_DN18561_c0_g1_i1.p1  ORF type:complete len:133 (+),score=15.29 TRINITY_DN18561_c0_g1_i1:89-487(+)